MPFLLSEFFWAFVPLLVAVQFTQQGLKHMTGSVLCSSSQPPLNTKKESIDRHFPSPAHLQSPEDGEIASISGTGNQGKGLERKGMF